MADPRKATKSEKRRVADCRLFPSEKNCSLMISGKEDEVLSVAVDLVVGDEALLPLDVRPHLVQNGARLVGDALQLFRGQLSRARDLALDYESRHKPS